jgi:hypothetical protein
MSVAGGIYIIVRGLDNFGEGIGKLSNVISHQMYFPVRIGWEMWVKRDLSSREDVMRAIEAEIRASEPTP